MPFLAPVFTVAGAAWASLALGAVSVGLSAAGAQQEAKAANSANEYNAKIQERNADISEMQATDAEQRGEVEAKQHRLRVAKLKGKQRTATAASGVTVDEGSPLSILEDTELFGELDAMTIRANAAREAWGHRATAGGHTAQASLSRSKKRSPGAALTTTIIGGGSQLASRFSSFKERGGSYNAKST